MTKFYDASNWENIPHGSDAMLYRDGRFNAPLTAPESLSLNRHRWITVTGDYRNCSVVDYEMFEPVYFPAGLRGFVRGRRSLSMDAIVYCNKSTAAEAVAALKDFGHGNLINYSKLYWWIATLDGIELTQAELARQMASTWEAPEITEKNLYADQYLDDGLKDTSNLFMPWLP